MQMIYVQLNASNTHLLQFPSINTPERTARNPNINCLFRSIITLKDTATYSTIPLSIQFSFNTHINEAARKSKISGQSNQC